MTARNLQDEVKKKGLPWSAVKGFDTFIPFTKDTFVTSYIAIPAFVLFWAGYKLYYRTRVIPLDKVDLVTGRRKIEEEEEQFRREQEMKGPRTRLSTSATGAGA